jgi:AcrR family transcriptional regulator
MPKPKTGRRGKSGIAKRRAAAKTEASDHYLERRRAAVQAAAAVFKEKSLAGTSIDDIAQAAGLDRSTLYYYFESKEELFREVVIDAVISNIKLAESVAQSDDTPTEKLDALIAGVMSSYAEYYPHLFVFLREDPTTILRRSNNDDIDILELSRRFDHALIDIIRAGIDGGVFRSDISPRLAAYGIVGMLNWSHRWFDPDGPVDTNEVAKAFASLAVDGLKKR